MAQTKAADLLNPEVLGDIVSAQLPNAIRFAPFAKVDNTLAGQAGDTLTRGKYAYVGAAEDLTEGVPMDPAKMSITTAPVTVKETGKAIEVTEKAILTNVNGTMEEAASQVTKSIADKLEIDYLATLGTATLSFNGTATTAANIIDAVGVFGDEDEEQYVLFVHPNDYTALSKSLIDGNTYLSKSQIAEMVGVSDIVKTNRLAEGTSYVQKVGAVEIVYKKRPQIKTDEDILARTFVIAGNQYYVTHLFNDNGVVKIAAAGV